MKGRGDVRRSFDLVHALAVEHTCELRAEARRERLARTSDGASVAYGTSAAQGTEAGTDARALGGFAGECGA